MTELDETKQIPCIGVISDCALQRHLLQTVLVRYGLTVAIICEPTALEAQGQDRLDQVECWILELDDEDFESEALDKLIDQAEVPVLFGLGKAPAKNNEGYISWERRLFDTLEEHLGCVEVLESEASILALDKEPNGRPEIIQNLSEAQNNDELSQNRPVAKEIWVLAASLGGPAAVKEFLDEMPANLPVGFLYAQHVDEHFSHVLTKVLGRHSELELKPMRQGDMLREGEVSVVPVGNEVIFKDSGVLITQKAWEGPYGPSIDHLLANVLRCYASRCHVIVFSGMGNDGALIAPRMKRQGCSVWAQTPESCANGSMPQSIIDLECSELTATPKELAQALIKRVNDSHAAENDRLEAQKNSSDAEPGVPADDQEH
ncbi:MAG: chemosensory pili system protein ChpB (putative protein-glutamate methylesterase) [Oleiphilaceae bacterium]